MWKQTGQTDFAKKTVNIQIRNVHLNRLNYYSKNVWEKTYIVDFSGARNIVSFFLFSYSRRVLQVMAEEGLAGNRPWSSVLCAARVSRVLFIYARVGLYLVIRAYLHHRVKRVVQTFECAHDVRIHAVGRHTSVHTIARSGAQASAMPRA